MVPKSRSGQERLTALAYLATVAALGLFYAAISYHSHQSFTWRNGGWYGELAQSFTQGKVSLLSQPSPGLIADPHPYAGVHDYPIKFDISYYHGKYYLYFGPTPAVLFFLPWLLATGQVLNQALVFWLLCMAGLILFGLLLHAIVRTYYPASPIWLQVLILVVFGLGNEQAYNIHFVLMYVIASMSAAVFATAMFYLLFLVLHGAKPQPLLLVAATLCWALAIGARPNMLFCGIVFLPLFYHFARTWPATRLLLTGAACAVFPAAVCVALLWYNHARFGRMLDFGLDYQVAIDADYTALPRFSLKYLPTGLFDYLFMPWRPSVDFPFFFPQPPRFRFFDPSGVDERYMGLLFAIPLLAYGALWPKFVKAKMLRLFALMLTLGAAAVFCLLVCHEFVQFYYFLDFTTPLFLLMAISLLAYRASHGAALAKSRLFWIVMAYTLYMGFAISIIGETNGIHTFQTYPPTPAGEPWLPDGETTDTASWLKN